MGMTRVEIDIPEDIVPFAVSSDKEAQLKRNAMLIYPYIQDGTISHGRAAEMLGMFKIDLIALYGKMGIAYFDESREELEADMSALKAVRGVKL